MVAGPRPALSRPKKTLAKQQQGRVKLSLERSSRYLDGDRSYVLGAPTHQVNTFLTHGCGTAPDSHRTSPRFTYVDSVVGVPHHGQGSRVNVNALIGSVVVRVACHYQDFYAGGFVTRPVNSSGRFVTRPVNSSGRFVTRPVNSSGRKPRGRHRAGLHTRLRLQGVRAKCR